MNTNKWLCYGMLLAMGCSSSPPAGSSSPIRDLLHDSRGDLGVARNPDPTPGDVGLAPDIPSYGPDISVDASPILEDAGVQIADAAPVSDSEIPDLANLPDAIVILDPDAGDAAVLDPDAGDAAVIPEADAFIPPVWPRRVPGPCEVVSVEHPSDAVTTTHLRYDEHENLSQKWTGELIINENQDACVDENLCIKSRQEDWINTYDERGFLVQTEIRKAKQINSVWEVPLEYTLTYMYTDSDLLESVLNVDVDLPNRGTLDSYDYDQNGNMDSHIVTSHPGRVFLRGFEYVYDDTEHLIEEYTYNDYPNPPRLSTRYTYSPDYLTGTMVDGNGGNLRNVTYNEFGQILVEESAPDELGGVRRESKLYDEVGNILSVFVEEVSQRLNRETGMVESIVSVLQDETYHYNCWVPPNQ